MVISDLLKSSVSFLRERETGLLESEILLAYVLGVSKEYLIVNNNEEVPFDLERLYQSYLERVLKGEPLAYITGEKEFYGLNFYVDKRVLIPRPETEQLVDIALKKIDGNARVLDVGTGSGNIAVSIAYARPGAEVLALDLSPEALEVARLNVDSHGVENRVQLAESDLLEAVDDGEVFDVIITNLPYIGEVHNRYVSDETFEHEPNLALFGGNGGLELYKKMFQQLVDKEVKFDLMLGEFGFGQGDEMRDLLNTFFDQKWEIFKDLAGIDRLFVVNMLK